MSVLSLGFRTDLMVLAAQGSSVEQRAGYFVIRTPHNPTYYWGNFLLLASVPAPGTIPLWVDTFHDEFPDAGHIAIGVDGTAGQAGDPAELTAAGLEVECNTVLTAHSVHKPLHPHRHAELRILNSDADWRAAIDLQLANNPSYEPESYRVFVQQNMTSLRQLCKQGYGAWFGAFRNDLMVSGLGIFTGESGVARFHSVDTHPDYRRQGLAGTLVYQAGQYAVTQLRAKELVIVADPEYPAIRLYRSLGFQDHEKQTLLFRPPDTDREADLPRKNPIS